MLPNLFPENNSINFCLQLPVVGIEIFKSSASIVIIQIEDSNELFVKLICKVYDRPANHKMVVMKIIARS